MKIQEKLINFIKNNKPKKIVIHNLKNNEDIENVIKQIYLQKLENYDYFFEKLDLILISNWLQISEFEELKNHWFKVFNLILLSRCFLQSFYTIRIHDLLVVCFTR